MSIFGFSIEPSSGGDWLPICQYDARAGRMFRTDRTQDTDGSWASIKEDITAEFKALVDFENVEVGWIAFPPGMAPSFVLVPMGEKIPNQPSELHKNGVRLVIKLAKNCGGDRPIRELASVARVFLAGVEQAYHQYLAGKAANPGKLPVLVLEKTVPVTTGSGTKSSTNYQPVFKLVGWAPRGDLAPQSRVVQQATAATASTASAAAPAAPAAQQQMPWNGNGAGSPPATGAQRVQPPPAHQHAVTPDDFG